MYVHIFFMRIRLCSSVYEFTWAQGKNVKQKCVEQ